MNLPTLRALGFTESTHIPFTKQYRVRCDSCQALCINGYPCHETGCPNEKHECKGCNAIVARGVRYCEDCQ